MYFNTDWQFGKYKRGKDNGHDTWSVVFLIFSNICCRYTSELPHRGDSDVYLQHTSFQ